METTNKEMWYIAVRFKELAPPTVIYYDEEMAYRVYHAMSNAFMNGDAFWGNNKVSIRLTEVIAIQLLKALPVL